MEPNNHARADEQSTWHRQREPPCIVSDRPVKYVWLSFNLLVASTMYKPSPKQTYSLGAVAMWQSGVYSSQPFSEATIIAGRPQVPLTVISAISACGAARLRPTLQARRWVRLRLHIKWHGWSALFVLFRVWALLDSKDIGAFHADLFISISYLDRIHCNLALFHFILESCCGNYIPSTTFNGTNWIVTNTHLSLRVTIDHDTIVTCHSNLESVEIGVCPLSNRWDGTIHAHSSLR